MAKICSKCKENKSLDSFGKHSISKNGLRPECKTCRKKHCAAYYLKSKNKFSIRYEKYKNTKNFKTIRNKAIEKFKNTEKFKLLMKSQYFKSLKRTGIEMTEAEYNEKNLSQNCVCAICRKPQKIYDQEKSRRLSVDHCHETKIIRGLLCHQCNLGLGYFHDNINDLYSAIEYLKFYSGGKNVKVN